MPGVCAVSAQLQLPRSGSSKHDFGCNRAEVILTFLGNITLGDDSQKLATLVAHTD